MAALVKAHPHEDVADVEQREVHRMVRRTSRVRLDIDVLCMEELPRPLDGELLYLIDNLVPAIVALAREALAVLVGEDTSHRLEHGQGDKILGGDHFSSLTLALQLAPDERVDNRVCVTETVHRGDCPHPARARQRPL